MPLNFAAVAPLIVHVVYRFDTGGLENGVVNLINGLTDYRHAVVALTEVVPSFASRIRRDDVMCVSMNKPPGHGVRLYPGLARLFRQTAPAIVHTRNLAALEAQVPAWWAGVGGRIHGEHGWDVGDLDGSSRRPRWLRRAYRPFVQHHIALSADLQRYLVRRVGVVPGRVTRIVNGVDCDRFHPPPGGRRVPLADSPFTDPALWVVGTVGRMQAVKGQTLLARAFVTALQQRPALAARLRLAMVGEGPLRQECAGILQAAGMSQLAWLPGERADVPDVMRSLDCFVLPSLAEGISNTILEAMASGLPLIATSVGGNPELIEHGTTGLLLPPGDVPALASALSQLADDGRHAAAMGAAGRQRAVRQFSLATMVEAYRSVYDGVLRRRFKE